MNLEELEAKINRLADIEEIKQLQHRYVNGLLTTNWDDMVDCFAEDGAMDFVGHELVKGKKELERVFKQAISKNHIGEEGPFAVHPIIDVEGDKAKGSWLMYVQYPFYRKHPNGQEAPEWAQGYYEMEYVRENGKWKISLLKWRQRMRAYKPQLIGIKEPDVIYHP